MGNQSKAYYLATIIASGFITMHKNRGVSSYFFLRESSEAGEASAKRRAKDEITTANAVYRLRKSPTSERSLFFYNTLPLFC